MKTALSRSLPALCALLAFALAGLIWYTPRHAQRAQAAVSYSGLHVSGNQLLNGAGQAVRPLGVDRSGTEYMCDAAGDTTVFDGPSDAASVAAMMSWHINAVRLPLNEDCWLGINGYPAAQYTAAQYRQAIIDYVNLLTANNLITILDLHWSAPGTQQANKQLAMPDLDHAPAFWTSVANTFKNNSSVIFDLYNEPFTTSWDCWLNGSTAANASPCTDVPFAVAGMQTLVNTVRATGATNVIMLGGLAYANDLSGWLSHKPSDPLNNLAASFHLYNFNTCNYVNCWVLTVAPVAAQVPVIAGEIGENDCAHGFIDMAMAWLDQNNIGYLAWAWDTYNCWSFPSLITDYNGTPTPYGQGLLNHLTDLANGVTPTPTPTPLPGHYCAVHYSASYWTGGMTANITISNISTAAIVGWTLVFTFPGDQQVTAGWSATWSQQGQQVTARDVGYNDVIAAGGSVSIGFNGTWTSNHTDPTVFTLNGVTCNTV
ncbi:cellulase family glycosylhydrolase [Thermogemmatispora sp.]|uniref:cellulase family glycosylhydrolase n=1 Tax=Thermogemmatispora sp. TaxID=1968838 RepID=UPI0035E4551A